MEVRPTTIMKKLGCSDAYMSARIHSYCVMVYICYNKQEGLYLFFAQPHIGYILT